MIRYYFYLFLNWLMRLVPPPLMNRFLRALHRQPELPRRAGYTVYPLTFYNPFPDPAQVDLARLRQPRQLPGINLDVPDALKLVAQLSAYAAEADQFLKSRTGDLKFWTRTYASVDSAALFAMLRHLRPRRYIEVGCGFSSRVSAAALRRNESDGHPCQALFIEPYPPKHLAELNLPGEFLQQKVEQVPLERFQALDAGDVLFIDTSHVIKVQNDVEFELLHVLPSLKPGVIVHIHDIFTPYDYPGEWLVGDGTNLGGANEQYALECLLSGGRDWQVTLPLFLLWQDHRAALNALVNSDERPAAFWIRKAVQVV
jgi:Methyltransferase domain